PAPLTNLFPYTTLFRSVHIDRLLKIRHGRIELALLPKRRADVPVCSSVARADLRGRLRLRDRLGVAALGHIRGSKIRMGHRVIRSEEHTSELQSRGHLV